MKKTAIDVGSTIVHGIGSMIGTSKVKKQQQEIDSLKFENKHLTQEIQVLHHKMSEMQKEHSTLTDKLKAELDKNYKFFPKIKEFLRIENLCKHLGFSDELTHAILRMKPVGFKGKLYSSEYQRKFETTHSVAEVKNHPTEKDKLQFTIDGVSDTNWFRQKQKQFLESVGVNPKLDISKKIRR